MDHLRKYRRPPPGAGYPVSVFRDGINTGDGSTQFWIESLSDLPEFALRAGLTYEPKERITIVVWRDGDTRPFKSIDVEIPRED